MLWWIMILLWKAVILVSESLSVSIYLYLSSSLPFSNPLFLPLHGAGNDDDDDDDNHDNDDGGDESRQANRQLVSRPLCSTGNWITKE